MNISNNKYVIKTDKGKNRLYLSILGFWASPNDVPNYVSDLDKASKELKNGFTIVTDVSNMKPPAIEVNAIHEQAQKLLMRAGLARTAEVVPKTARIQKMAVDQYSKHSGMQKETFYSVDEAEEWLNS
jgi:hypothetical protein